jgi:hypothetical protein
MPWTRYNAREDKEERYAPGAVKYLVLATASSTYSGHIADLTRSVKLIFRELDINDFLIMGDYPTAWRSRAKQYEGIKVSRIMKFFEDHGIGLKFNGAVNASLQELDLWLKYIAYAVRVNALVPEMNFLDPKQRLYFSLCQYGNLHLTILDKDLLASTKTLLESSNRLVVLETQCGFERYNAKPRRST